jgi:hypothetical protein
MGASDILGKLGGIIVGGFGDRAIIGFLMGLLAGVTPDEFYLFIKDKKELLGEVSPEDWDTYGRLARDAHLEDITTERILEEFKKYHPEFLQIIVNQPGAMDWLDNQVVIIKKRLGLSE